MVRLGKEAALEALLKTSQKSLSYHLNSSLQVTTDKRAIIVAEGRILSEHRRFLFEAI